MAREEKMVNDFIIRAQFSQLCSSTSEGGKDKDRPKEPAPEITYRDPTDSNLSVDCHLVAVVDTAASRPYWCNDRQPPPEHSVTQLCIKVSL